MNDGYITLHRKILNWEWSDKPEIFSFFIHLLLMANHQPCSWRGNQINRGQLITSLPKLSKTIGISLQTTRTLISKLKSTGEITDKSTNKFRLITIVKYDEYQLKQNKLTSKSTDKPTGNQQATNRQLTANNNDNNDNNENKVILHSEQCSQAGNEINLLLTKFKEINPMIQYGNKSQRTACKQLLDQFNLDELSNLIDAYKQLQEDRFCPVITTPLQLRDKLASLKNYINNRRPQTFAESIV